MNTSVPLGPWRTLAAADVSYDRGSPILYAAVVVVERGTWALKARVGVAAPASFPYVPGLLSFRELPAVLEAFSRLDEPPDLVLCDGQGIAHPKRLGLASHLGLWLGLPTIGCAKSLLCGTYDEPGPERGDRSPLIIEAKSSARWFGRGRRSSPSLSHPAISATFPARLTL